MYSWGIKGFDKPLFYGVKPPLENEYIFFFGPWLLVCQFVEVSNQMESNGEQQMFI